MTLHKYDPDAYMTYYICHICVDILRAYQEERNCGYGRMVKFLFAKEKTRVRFPLSAHDLTIVYKKFILTFSLLSPIQPKKV